jgi:hypothetical protein
LGAKHRRWLDASAIISALALAVSLAAFGVSVRGCSISQYTFAMQRRDFDAVRRIVFTGDVDNSGYSIKVIPTDPTFNVQWLELCFPTKFAPNFDVLHQPLWFDASSEADDVISVAKELLPRRIEGACIVEGVVPVVVETAYTYKGERLRDRSLYGLVFKAHFVEEQKLHPIMSFFRRLQFVRRIGDGEDSRALVDVLWNAPKRT